MTGRPCKDGMFALRLEVHICISKVYTSIQFRFSHLGIQMSSVYNSSLTLRRGRFSGPELIDKTLQAA